MAAQEQDRLTLWVPVFFGAGVVLYFARSSEPVAWVAPLFLGTALGALPLVRQSLAPRMVLCAVASLMAGFVTADWRAARVDAPVLDRAIRALSIEGILLEKTNRAEGGTRVVIAPTHLGRQLKEGMPARIRINIRTQMDRVLPGDVVSVRAGLMPPPGPAAPSAFDFGRQAYFRQLGAVGYAISPLARVAPAPNTWTTCLRFCISRLRDALTDRIVAALSPPQGAIAAALMTGDRGGIPENVLQDLRDTGLAHLLAISGLHMALFAGAIFWGVRGLLALLPTLVLKVPIKKWAAAAALIGGFGYLLVSGGSVATQRAFVMFTLIFVAVMLDRPAITMRNVALAAMIVMVLTPEAVMEASFQMSFSAAIALVAFYEASRPWLSRWNSAMAERGMVAKGALYLGGIALTSIVASLATAPFAAFHFNRVVDFGLVANLAAMPIVGFVVMPAALLAFVAMPFGLEAIPLWAAGQGISLITMIADTVASWPGAITAVPAMPDVSLALLIAGGLWMALWATSLRWIGMLGPISGIALAMTSPYPDVLVDRDAELVAVRDVDERLALSASRRAGFSAETWLRRDADLRSQKMAAASLFVCDADGCISQHADIGLISVPRTWRGLVEDCDEAAVIVTDTYAPLACRVPVIIDRSALQRRGSHALYADAHMPMGVRIVTACDVSGIRPWTRCRP
ncbi:MAG: ComEC/Rec2 family competence protein [Alphaproteobacteria bacterium]|nr:ComEC/Rec2 family competence protein [Alphaproteobacteria bacterium]